MAVTHGVDCPGVGKWRGGGGSSLILRVLREPTTNWPTASRRSTRFYTPVYDRQQLLCGDGQKAIPVRLFLNPHRTRDLPSLPSRGKVVSVLCIPFYELCDYNLSSRSVCVCVCVRDVLVFFVLRESYFDTCEKSSGTE